MLQLRKRILSHILPPSPTATTIPPILSLRRLLSATPTPFAAEDYLVANCGLSGAQALKASKKISHLKSSSKPDAVLDFLAGLGLSRAEVATVVTKDPLFLCADVQKTLVPRVVGLTGLGMSRAEIARLVLTVQVRFRVAPLHRNLDFWISVFGSFDELLQVLKVNSGFLCLDLEKVAKPNVEFLQQCGISLSDVPHRFLSRMVCRSRDHLQEALARVYEFGIEQSSWAFIHGFARFAILGREKLNKNIQVFEKLGWSRDDISSAVRRAPGILCLTEERVKRGLEFLMGDVMLDIPYIAQRPVLMLFSLERRLLPRHLMINFLESRELLRTQLSFYSIALIGEEKFLETFVHPYEDSVPGLAAAYASSCAGKHQWELLCGSTPGEGKVEKALVISLHFYMLKGLNFRCFLHLKLLRGGEVASIPWWLFWFQVCQASSSSLPPSPQDLSPSAASSPPHHPRAVASAGMLLIHIYSCSAPFSMCVVSATSRGPFPRARFGLCRQHRPGPPPEGTHFQHQELQCHRSHRP